jgi:hypothetical protein
MEEINKEVFCVEKALDKRCIDCKHYEFPNCNLKKAKVPYNTYAEGCYFFVLNAGEQKQQKKKGVDR